MKLKKKKNTAANDLLVIGAVEEAELECESKDEKNTWRKMERRDGRQGRRERPFGRRRRWRRNLASRYDGVSVVTFIAFTLDDFVMVGVNLASLLFYFLNL